MKNTHIWLVAYINSDLISTIDRDIKKYKSLGVRYFIPIVKVGVKKLKGKVKYKEVPFLLNYGFFRIPREKAIDQKFLDEFKLRVGCLFAWVKDRAKKQKRWVKGKNRVIKSVHVPIATIRNAELNIIKRQANKNDIYNEEQVEKVKPGDMVTLHGYPFEGLIVTIVEMDVKRKKAIVSVSESVLLNRIEVSFENFIYTIYKNPNVEDLPKNKSNGYILQSSDKSQFQNHKP